MNLLLVDDLRIWNELLPLTFTRPVSDLRIGILKIREKWEHELGLTAGFQSADYLAQKFPGSVEEDNLLIRGHLLPTSELVEAIRGLELGSALVTEAGWIAARVTKAELEAGAVDSDSLAAQTFSGEVELVEKPSDIFSKNGAAIEADYDRLTAGRESQPLHASNTVIGDRVFVEEGASVLAATLNSESGPIYIGKNAVVMEGSLVRGGLALCESAQLKLGAKIYGPTTVGPHSKVGGEVSSSVIQGFSNKGHDGFLGNSVLGEWCNLGADTNTSNLKNNYAPVRLWNYGTGRFAHTGLQFCGLIMGDHSKCGINTMFNTGTVVGVSANVFGAGFPRNFIPSFSWGGAQGFTTYRLDKVCEVAETVMARRKISLTDEDKAILQAVFDQTAKYRS